MKYGIFSDVHANLEALTAVLDHASTLDIERWIFLGDVVGYGADPVKCIKRVSEVSHISILGNHDAAVSDRMDYSYYYEGARTVLEKHRALLSKDQISWMKSLPYEHIEGDLGFTHGAPVNVEAFEYIFSVEQAKVLLPIRHELPRINFLGHSHLCKVFSLNGSQALEHRPETIDIDDDATFIVSVGSCGQPRDNDPRAAFVSYDTSSKQVQFYRVDYDIDAAARKILASGQEENFAHRLYFGV